MLKPGSARCIKNLKKIVNIINNDYYYRRNYISILEPENFVTVFPNGGNDFSGGCLTDLPPSKMVRNLM